MSRTIQELGVADILEGLGIDLEDPNFNDTPSRWLKFISEFLQPYDPAEDLLKQFQQLADVQEQGAYGHPMVVQSNIPYQAVCAHHLVPVLGRAAIGYIPHYHVVGLSKLARLVWGLSHSTPSLQEDITNQTVDALQRHLDCLGSICVIKAEHGCMACRGIGQQDITTTTSALRGVFAQKAEARAEFYSLAGL